MAARIAQKVLQTTWDGKDVDWDPDLFMECGDFGTVSGHQAILCAASPHIAQMCEDADSDFGEVFIDLPESKSIVRSICAFIYGHDFDHVFIGSGQHMADTLVQFLVAADKYGLPTMGREISASMIEQIRSMRGTDLCCLRVALLESARTNIVPQMVLDIVFDFAARRLKEIMGDDKAWSALQSNSEFLKAVLTDAGALIAGD
ncbi:hypothetical protein CB0940_10263 [Cercospora beticola]|uniref:Uncharacterized protein n=1 Tax=Cercospora beticola TaxID=122368 RepID=A0A2G5HV02_CERBT|nr:hypothetical protein CB0940_10263 [Cercospora beticola]PIA96366.1 hypothetical protein CB0940_10263 [Cercospora beticola]WPB06970.1 hypothetical protein RHO25_011630 [Cercospora beticola]